MISEREESGVLMHAIYDLFQHIDKDQYRSYFLKVAYVEIYNELVYDLLRSEKGTIGESLQLVEDGKSKDFYIRGVTEETVHSISDILEIITRGE